MDLADRRRLRTKKNVLISSSTWIGSFSAMSEVVYSVKMSSSSSRSEISFDGGTAARLADEVLLAGRADEVVVLVAEAHVLERLEAA